MFTRDDYLNLAAVVSMAKVEGIAQASWLLVTHEKLVKAANPQPIEDEVKQQSEGLQCHADDVTLTEE
jgi:hypothetical protein